MRRVLGLEHSYTLETLHGLAIIYQEQGRIADTVGLLDELLKHKNLLGEKHPDTIRIINQLMNLHQGQNNTIKSDTTSAQEERTS